MMLNKVLCAFCILLLIMANTNPVIALEVSLDECPNDCNSYPIDPTDPCLNSCESCHRTDGAITLVAAGSPNTWLNVTQNCFNCTDCPDCPPTNVKDCTKSVNETFTETVTVTVGSSIEAGEAGIKASLSQSIGHSTQRSISVIDSCTIHVDPCKKQTHGVSNDVTSGISKEMDHTYQYYGDLGCSCQNCYWNAGSDTSSANGDDWIDSSATCYNVTGTLDCD